MTTPLWLILLPIGISCVALVVSGMTYRLAIKRDDEAREFVLMERQHEIVVQYHKLMNDLDELTSKYGDTEDTVIIRSKMQISVAEIDKFDFSQASTRELRRSMEQIYRKQAMTTQLMKKLPQELEAIAAKAIRGGQTPGGQQP